MPRGGGRTSHITTAQGLEAHLLEKDGRKTIYRHASVGAQGT